MVVDLSKSHTIIIRFSYVLVQFPWLRLDLFTPDDMFFLFEPHDICTASCTTYTIR